MAGDDHGEVIHGGRSSDTRGFGVPVHDRTSWWSGSSPRSNPSTMTRPGANYGVCSHDGDMAGGRELSAPTEEAARGRERARGGGEKAAELTVDRTEGSASSGKDWTALEPRRRSSDPRMKMTSMAMMQGTRRLVA